MVSGSILVCPSKGISWHFNHRMPQDHLTCFLPGTLALDVFHHAMERYGPRYLAEKTHWKIQVGASTWEHPRWLPVITRGYIVWNGWQLDADGIPWISYINLLRISKNCVCTFQNSHGTPKIEQRKTSGRREDDILEIEIANSDCTVQVLLVVDL